MLSYQHAYHAGNFADVIKHLVLCRILSYMCEKDKPLFYLETHSGRGLYDLKAHFAQKTLEFLGGIQLLWDAVQEAPPVFQAYLNPINALNPDGKLHFYPGSPSLALFYLRSQDRLFFAEKHPEEFSHLQCLVSNRKRVYLKDTDGMHELIAQLPPPERRGLIFIDPSYEIKEEYKTIPQALAKAYDRFATGVYVLWYPIIEYRLHKQLFTGLHRINSHKILQIEWQQSPGMGNGMQGCGLWVINPPYLLAEEIRQALEFLTKIFNPGQSSYLLSKE